ncbi:MAG TPA: phage major tail tube protein [Methylocystis sp.]|jgi:hypothetical protein
MAQQLEYILQAWSAYVDGFPKIGSGEKAATPKFKKKMEDYRGGGMLATRQISLGYEAFELALDFSEYDPQVIAQCGLFTKKDVSLTVRGHFDGDSNTPHTGILQCRGEFKEINPDDWEAGKKAGLKTMAALSKLKLTMDSTVIYDVDIKANVYVFGNEDAGAAIRASLGF